MILAIIPSEIKQKNTACPGMPQSDENDGILNSPKLGELW